MKTDKKNNLPDFAKNVNGGSDLKEKAVHGDVLFPLERYATSFHPLKPVLDIHWHPEMEITRVREGTVLYSVDLQEFEVTAGDFVCVQPNLLHSAKLTSRSSAATNSFVFHLNLLGNSSADICTLRYFKPIMDGTLKIPPIIYKTDSIYKQIDHIFPALSKCFDEKPPGYELEIKSLLFLLLQLLITHGQTRYTDADSLHSERLKTVFDYIHTHYAENISIDTAAQLCCITPSRFMHFFKEKSGLTFNQYLNQYRLSQSAILLRQGIDIADTAYTCGFNNLSYFYKRFQEYYHMTPRQFKMREHPD